MSSYPPESGLYVARSTNIGWKVCLQTTYFDAVYCLVCLGSDVVESVDPAPVALLMSDSAPT